jgi:hypothetical protein
VGLLKQQKRVLVLGRQVGSLKLKDVPFGVTIKVYRHGVKSFERLWDEVGRNTGSKLVVKTKDVSDWMLVHIRLLGYAGLHGREPYDVILEKVEAAVSRE